jgi:hypothetical protein
MIRRKLDVQRKEISLVRVGTSNVWTSRFYLKLNKLLKGLERFNLENYNTLLITFSM